MALYQTRHGELSNWKGCAAANASRNAVFAALLAQEGFTGPTSIFEGKGGLYDAVGRFEWPLPDDDGAPRYIERTHFKCFPICYHGQTAVWAALDARPQLGGARIERIELETYKSAVEIMANDRSRWSPTTHETADHSLPFVIASALRDGEVTVASFEHSRLVDAETADLMKKVEVRESAACTARYPEAAPCQLTITAHGGKKVRTEVLYPKGHNMNPLTDAEIDLKFSQMFRDFGPAEKGAGLLKELRHFDEIKDLRRLLADIPKASFGAGGSGTSLRAPAPEGSRGV
jgi:2-methylcitrate dehydratase